MFAALFAGVSIHAPTKGATAIYLRLSAEEQFQSTLPRRERRCICRASSRCVRFNPRSHEGSDRRYKRKCYKSMVSIHAPTKGATGLLPGWRGISPGFNPRSHEGSDLSCLSTSLTLFCFNPRSHEGSDAHRQPSHLFPPVSIHAPTKGATRRSPGTSLWLGCFNPRSHEGSDNRSGDGKSSGKGFNPRSHEGSDMDQPDQYIVWAVSIHAPTRDLVLSSSCLSLSFWFQSTLPRRERLISPNCRFRADTVSIHAPTKGATLLVCHFSVNPYVSIHAPTKGATTRCLYSLIFSSVSIHAPTKGAT